MSRSSRRSAQAAASSPDTVADQSLRVRRSVPLGDLDIARENLRFGEGPDDEVPLLAETLLAAGQMQPITVRPGRGKTEKPLMALDGRRRLLALRLLLEQGRIASDHPVDVFVETDPARQAAAVLLTNTAVPVHVADVIASIGRMLKARLTVSGISRALGYEEIEIKRLAALAGLPGVAIEALKAGRLSMRQARLLARLPDRKEQAEIAHEALDGRGFPDWRIKERLEVSRITTRDPRFALVGEDRYSGAGGRMESDLFGELAPVLLDPEILTELWLKRAREIALVFEGEGVAVHVSAGSEPEMAEDLEPLGYGYGRDLKDSERAAWEAAKAATNAAADHVRDGVDLASDEAIAYLVALVRAWIARDQAGVAGRVVTEMTVCPSTGLGIEVQCFSPVEAEEPESEDEANPDASSRGGPAAYRPPQAEAPPPEIEGVGHSLHALRTDVATRGLIRALADHPAAALVALVARLFGALVVRSTIQSSDAALTITAKTFSPRDGRMIEALDGAVHARLEVRRAAWEASGQTVIAWVQGLGDDERSSLLAELTAVSFDLREGRTDLVRSVARAEAAELSALCGADIREHWTPDPVFLRAHGRPQLLEMLASMQIAPGAEAALRKTELADRTAELAAERRWAPACLDWGLPADEATEPGVEALGGETPETPEEDAEAKEETRQAA